MPYARQMRDYEGRAKHSHTCSKDCVYKEHALLDRSSHVRPIGIEVASQ